jgi:excisionase family DNA binding protein
MPVRDENGDELLTLREAAEELGLSASTLRVQVKRGRLHVVALTSRLNLIYRTEVETYKRESLGQPPGPKPRTKRAPGRPDAQSGGNDAQRDH